MLHTRSRGATASAPRVHLCNVHYGHSAVPGPTGLQAGELWVTRCWPALWSLTLSCCCSPPCGGRRCEAKPASVPQGCCSQQGTPQPRSHHVQTQPSSLATRAGSVPISNASHHLPGSQDWQNQHSSLPPTAPRRVPAPPDEPRPDPSPQPWHATQPPLNTDPHPPQVLQGLLVLPALLLVNGVQLEEEQAQQDQPHRHSRHQQLQGDVHLAGLGAAPCLVPCEAADVHTSEMGEPQLGCTLLPSPPHSLQAERRDAQGYP